MCVRVHCLLIVHTQNTEIHTCTSHSQNTDVYINMYIPITEHRNTHMYIHPIHRILTCTYICTFQSRSTEVYICTYVPLAEHKSVNMNILFTIHGHVHMYVLHNATQYRCVHAHACTKLHQKIAFKNHFEQRMWKHTPKSPVFIHLLDKRNLLRIFRGTFNR